MSSTDEEKMPSGDAWMDAMRRGDFAAAWRISDAVLRSRAQVPCWHWPRHQQYIWNGAALTGRRVLIRCYHGLGDTVQFIRYAPLVKAVAREVIVWAQPALVPLLRTAPGIDRLLPLHDGAPDMDYDVDVELMELPHVFRTTLETIPTHVPYLNAARAWIGTKADLLNVGVVWRAGDWDLRRAVPIRQMRQLANVPGVAWHILQQGSEANEWPAEVGVKSARERPEKLASVMRALDLVISVDSFPAHLAGALGVPVWTLLQAEADWRWMENREDSPWYPTMRLFRQPHAGDWDSVLTRVQRELAAEAKIKATESAGVSLR